MRLLATLAVAARIVSMVALAAMMLVTIVDVTLRNTINELVLGGVELVQLALVTLVFLALPETVLRGEHIAIDIIDRALPPRGVLVLRAAIAVLALLFFAVLAWRMVLPAIDTIAFGDRTSDLGIPFAWYWLPLVIGVVLAAVAQLALAAQAIAGLRRGDPT